MTPLTRVALMVDAGVEMPRWMRIVSFLIALQMAVVSCTKTVALQSPYADPEAAKAREYRIRLNNGVTYRAQSIEPTDSSLILIRPEDGNLASRTGYPGLVESLEVDFAAIESVERIQSAPGKTTAWIAAAVALVALMAAAIASGEFTGSSGTPAVGGGI